MFDGHLRVAVDRAVKPLGQALRRTKISPDQLTIVGMVMGCAAAVAIASGHLLWGLILVILAALPDLLDGALAKATSTASPRGAFFDSVVDRVTDALLFGGVAWYFASTQGAHLAILPLAISGMSSVISYERAKAEALGLSAKGGLMERAERIIFLCLGLLFSAILIPILWIMLVLTTLTAIQRFIKVWKQAEVAPITAAKIEQRRTRRQHRRNSQSSRASRISSGRKYQ